MIYLFTKIWNTATPVLSRSNRIEKKKNGKWALAGG
jgi:hypothetical protein